MNHSVIILLHAIVWVPLSGACFTGLCRNIFPKSLLTGVCTLAVLLSMIFSLELGFYADRFISPTSATLYTWLQLASLTINWGYYLDKTGLFMLMMVNTVSFLVHVYSLGYMEKDESQPRFFSYLCLFTFMMNALILSSNLFMLFFGWEGVGMCSYLLIGFWMEKPKAQKASYKAFLINRFGDLGILLAIAMLVAYAPTLEFTQLPLILPAYPFNYEMIAFCIILGVCAKSAQFPLHAWLPDSMEGPTPISALIHAATMVTAGIFLIIRLESLFLLAPVASSFMVYLGLFTGLVMAAIACTQYDIKRVIAYSTISQLGYMLVAAGAQAYQVSLFHLLMHGFFKSLLFLTAGALSYVYHHDQDIRGMGRLDRVHLKFFIPMLIGLASMMGVPPLNGFFSKTMIFESLETNYGHLMLLECLGVVLTAFYSLRLFYFVFFAHLKEIHSQGHHEVIDTPLSMNFSLYALTFLSLVTGVVGYQWIFGKSCTEFLLENSLSLALLLNCIVAFGIWMYRKCLLLSWAHSLGPVLGLELFYNEWIPLVARYLTTSIDRYIEKILVEGFFLKIIRWIHLVIGYFVSLLHTGSVQTHALIMMITFLFSLHFIG